LSFLYCLHYLLRPWRFKK